MDSEKNNQLENDSKSDSKQEVESYNAMENALNKSRLALLDLSKRNRLIHMRSTSRSALPIVDEKPNEIFSILVERNQTMRFLNRKDVKSENVSQSEKTDHPMEASETPSAIQDSVPSNDNDTETTLSPGEPEERHIDLFLQTELTKAKLSEKLTQLQRDTQTALEEQGTHLLFLALGFLEWEESQTGSRLHSPLVLVPVSLERKNILSPFRLIYNGEDIQINLCLEKKLNDEYGLSFSDDTKMESREDLESYFRHIEDQISDKEDWNLTDDISLGLFTFTKFLMYKDLDPRSWKNGNEIFNQPLLNSLLSERHWDQDLSNEWEDNAEDPIIDDYLVMDSDESQRNAILSAVKGTNLIIQGPPGTGKSQTITNLIAQFLANDKRVLFVSEKRAALDVVKNRLDEVGLGDFSLEIHSRDSSKRGFLQSLEKALKSPRPLPPRDKRDKRKFDSIVERLRSVGIDLITPVSNSGLSPYYLIGKCLYYKDKDLPKLQLEESIFFEPTSFDEAVRLTEEFSDTLKKVGNPKEHIFKDVETTDLLPNEVEESRFVLSEILANLKSIQSLSNNLSEKHNLKKADLLKVAPLYIDLWDRLSDNPFNSVTDLESINWSMSREALDSFTEAFLKYADRYKKLKEFYHPEFIPWNELEKHKQIIDKSNDSLFRVFNSEYNESCKSIRKCLKTTQSMRGKDLLMAIEFLQEAQKEKQSFESVEEKGPYIVGPVWVGIETPDVVTIPRIRWVQQSQPIVHEGIIEALQLATFAQSENWRESGSIIEDLEKAINATQNSLEALDRLLYTPGLRWQSLLSHSLDQLIVKFDEMLEEVDALWDWIEFRRSAHLLEESPARQIADLALNGIIDESNATDTLNNHYYSSLLDKAFHERQGLTTFQKESLESAIKQFQELDQKLIFHSRQRLAYELGQKSPRILEGLSGDSSELGLVQREIHKKRRIKPIRRILRDAGTLIQKIKPCFMMSPLSVAQFLPSGELEFDVVIFDEASQMKPEDALGAIARGKQLIVVGDSKQLPPTRFFNKLDSDDVDWEEGDESLTDLESILDACAATGMQTRILSWHYRSQHDSLIATSNKEFYENRLTIFPSPYDRNDRLGLHFMKVEDGLFERGGSSSNPIEAKAVAKAVIEHARHRPGESLGVGTFSIRQQATILDEVDTLRRELADPGIESFFSTDKRESFFVKNLENIQGDERDVIFLSVCYARHDLNKPMAMNFGPLNQEGGERRLNVLITRAKKKCVIYSSIGSEEIDLERTDARGVKALKSFLHFAEYGEQDDFESNQPEDATPFENRIHKQLQSMGYQVRRQVGTGIFRLNFGIRHPNNIDQFALGIECDGSAFMSAPESRERERTRVSVMQNMGWNIHRIWSMDWFRNQEQAQESIRKTLEKAISQNEKPVQFISDKGPEFEGINLEESTDALDLMQLGVPYQKWQGEIPKTGRTLAKEIVLTEGPIHEDELIDLLKQHLSISRLTSKMRAELLNHIYAALRDRVIMKLDDEPEFYIGSKFKPESLRPRTREKLPVMPEHISELEIAAAAYAIIHITGEIPLSELAKNISLLLGYKSLSGKIQSRIESGLNRSNLKLAGLKMDHRQRVAKISDDSTGLFSETASE